MRIKLNNMIIALGHYKAQKTLLDALLNSIKYFLNYF